MLLLFHRRDEIELDLARRVVFLGSGKNFEEFSPNWFLSHLLLILT